MKNKFYFLILIGLFAFCTPAKALLVNIPDANLRAYLQATYPTCFVGAQMETTCTEITSATQLTVNGLNIADLTGIEHFTSLQVLRCSNNQIASLPNLPNLVHLRCSNNLLTSLPNVFFTRLSCDGNFLDFADLESVNGGTLPNNGGGAGAGTDYFANPQSYAILPATQGTLVGGTLTINGAIGGSSNLYQWYKDNTLISGATSSTYTKINIISTDAGIYKCIVTSAFSIGRGGNTTTGVTITSSNVNINVSCPTITFTNTTAVAVAIINTSYTLDASASNATFYFVLPALPAGLSLDPTTGVISGVPTTVTVSATYIVTAAQGACTAVQSYTFEASCPTITFTNTTAVAAVTNYPYWLNASASNAASYSVLPALPAGLSLNTTTGIISGSFPVATASTTYAVTATLGTCSATQNYTFGVGCATFINTNATDFIVGEGGRIDVRTTLSLIGYAYTYSISPALPTGLVLNSFDIGGVCLFTVPSTTYTVTAVGYGGCTVTQNYTFAVICPTIVFGTTVAANPVVGDAYWFSIGIAGANYSTSTISIIPSLPAGLNLIGGIIRGTPTVSAPSRTYTVTARQGTCTTTQSYSFAVVCPTITINPTGSYNTSVNAFFQTTFSVVGLSGTPVWSLTGALPSGLVFNASNGNMRGTPTIVGNFNFTIGVTNGVCSQTNAYSFRVSNCPTIFLSRLYLKATVGVGYNSSPLHSNHRYSIIPSLPMGFTLNVNTGVISGTSSVPTPVARYIITATAVGFPGCSSSEDLDFEVESCPIMTIANSPNSNSVAYSLVVGRNLPFSVSITGNPSDLNYSITTALPSGLSLNASTGLIDGIPTTTMTSTDYTIIVRRGTICSLTINLALTITGCPAFNTTPAPVVPINRPYTFNAGISTPRVYGVRYWLYPNSLPTGLNFDETSGIISGTCTLNQPSINYRIEAWPVNVGGGVTAFNNLCNTGGAGAVGFFTLTTACPALSFRTTATLNPIVGTLFSLDAGIATNQDQMIYFIPSTSPALPVGLTLNTQTGVISGTPISRVATATYTIYASIGYTGCIVSQNYTFAVDCSTISPFNTLATPDAIVGNGYLFNIGVAGSGSNIYSTIPALPSGFYISISAGSIVIATSSWANNTPVPSDIYTITVTTQGGCSYTRTCTFAVVCPPAAFTNTIATNAIYNSLYTLNAGATGNGITGYLVDPALPQGLSLNTSTGFISGYAWSGNVPSNTYTVTAIRGNCSISQGYTFAVVCPPITFVNTTAVNAVVGNPYTLSVSATGAWQYSVNFILPAGLTLNTNTGIISGTPTASVVSTTYTVTATQGQCSRTQEYAFGVVCPTVIFNTSPAPNAVVGGNYSFNIGTVGGASNRSYLVSPALPSGFGVGSSGSNIMIGGSINTSVPLTSYTITITMGSCTAIQICSFAVVCPPATFTNTIATNAISGATYTLNVSATGWGITGYSINQVLPPGLNLNASTGIISGTLYGGAVPSTTYIVTAIRGGDCSITQDYSFAVVCPPIVVNSVSLLNGGINVNYNQNIPFPWGASAPIVWSISSGTLPPGLALTSSGTFNMNGLISGIPTTSGTFTFVIQTTSINSCPRRTSYTIAVTPNVFRVNNIAEVISASPNPSSGDFNIDFSILDITNATMVLYNSQGRRVLSANIDNSQMLISIVNEPAGLYLLEITNASGKIIKRLMKQ